MTTAIRIEHPSDGIGIFVEHKNWLENGGPGKRRDSDIILDLYDDTLRYMFKRHTKFHNPIEDELHFVRNRHFCAFKSAEQLRGWILPNELSYIASKGYRIYKLELSDCQIGRDNIVFQKEHITDKTDITDIFVNEN